MQVGAFQDATNAREVVTELKGQGYRAVVKTTTVGGVHHHRVRVGRFQTYHEAETLAGRLRRDGYPTQIVP